MVLRYGLVGLISLPGTTLLVRNLGADAWASYTVAYFLTSFLDLNLGTRMLGALVVRDEGSDDVLLRSAAGFLYLVGAGCLVLCVALAWPLDVATSLPEIGLCMVAVGICGAVYSWRSVALTMLERRLDYRFVAVAEVLDQIVFYAIAIPLVLTDHGIAGVAVAIGLRGVPSALLLRTMAKPPRALFAGRRAYRQIADFALPALGTSGFVLVEGLIPVACLAGGHPGELGFFMTASSLAGYAGVVTVVVQRVGFPSLALLREEPAQFQRAIDGAERGTVFISMLLLVPLVSLSPLWLEGLFGPEWRQVGWVMLAIGSGFAVNGPIGVMMGALYALGAPRKVTVAYVSMTAAYLLLAVAGVQVSVLVGVAVAFALSRALGAVVLVSALQRSGYHIGQARTAALVLCGIGLAAAGVAGVELGIHGLTAAAGVGFAVAIGVQAHDQRALVRRIWASLVPSAVSAG